MSNHWPIVAATLMVAAAIGAGVYRHDELARVATTPPVIKPLQVPAAPSAPAVDADTPAAAPARPAPAFKSVGVRPAVPVAVAGVAIAVPTEVSQMFTELRAALQAALQSARNLTTTSLKNTTSTNAEGVRIELVELPAWSVSLYNDNKAAPQTESKNFKTAFDTVVKILKIDIAQVPAVTVGPRTVTRCESQLGTVMLTRDPALGNACFIRPVPKLATNPAAKAQPNQPAVGAVAAPAVPPDAPADDNF